MVVVVAMLVPSVAAVPLVVVVVVPQVAAPFITPIVAVARQLQPVHQLAIAAVARPRRSNAARRNVAKISSIELACL